MKKLTVLSAIVLIAAATLSSSAARLTNPTHDERTLPTITFELSETARRLVSLGNHYARRGQLELALEHYSRSIRVGKLADPDYADLATQNKIIALVKQLGQVEVHQTVERLIRQGDACATVNPEQALELYSRSVRVGKQHDNEYTDAGTQTKIMKLVQMLGISRGK